MTVLGNGRPVFILDVPRLAPRHDGFGPREVDALQELATIGCGRAITALGKLAGRRFEMDVPEAWVGAEAGAIAAFLGGARPGPRRGGRAARGAARRATPPRAARGRRGGARRRSLGFPPARERRRGRWAGHGGERAHGVGQHRRERVRLGGRHARRREAAPLRAHVRARQRQGLRRAARRRTPAPSRSPRASRSPRSGDGRRPSRGSSWSCRSRTGSRGSSRTSICARQPPHGRAHAAPAPRRRPPGRHDRRRRGRALKHAPFERMGDVATIDTHRALRVGMPEVVLAESKTAAQIAAIAKKLAAAGPLLVTRLAPDKAAGGEARREGRDLRPGLAHAAQGAHGRAGARAGGGLLRGHERHPGVRGGGGHARRHGRRGDPHLRRRRRRPAPAPRPPR